MKNFKQMQEIARAKMAVKIAATTTKSLPKADLNRNHSEQQNRQIIFEAAFQSSLENGVIFLIKDDYNISAQVKGLSTTHMKSTDFEEAAQKLTEWSGYKIDKYQLYNGLITEAGKYKMQQGKRKSSEDYLNELIEVVIDAEINLDENLKRIDTIERLGQIVAGIALEIGIQFFRDKRNNLYLNCLDNKFGLTSLKTKDVLPYFRTMVLKASGFGRVKSDAEVNRLIENFKAFLPLVK
ncbi:hypothetical protein HPE56_10600 [Maribacter sp. ANRC-HE7]|uniref:RteC protein n=1 Tax=Maribacter aquimaris TaxID=2737171 RepID=A0ABR7V0E1_9FLAO|nr:hypothetical protein [Maribacter aquimaris]MBD0778243.1 hypothetical protein [Maribacter aquimaris]